MIEDSPMTTTATDRLTTGAAGDLVHVREDPTLGRIEIAVLDPERDAALVHRWVSEPVAQFWGMGGKTVAEVRDVYAFVDSLPSHHAFLVRRDGQPVALLQTYEPENDPVGDCYTPAPGDVGMHFLLAARGAPVARYSTRLGIEIGRFLFVPAAAARIVIEPDARNDRALRRTELMGFELGPEIELPGKTGQLAFLTRERWRELAASL